MSADATASPLVDAGSGSRRRVLVVATSGVAAVGVAGAAVPFIGSWNPSARAKAAGAPVKADISKLEPGQMAVIEWRGKPVYVVRRTRASTCEQPDDAVREFLAERQQPA